MREDTPVVRQLRQAGLRHTPVRAGVLKLLSEASKPMDVGDLAANLPDGTDIVTLYRTLKTFLSKGLAHRVRDENRAWRYVAGGDVEDGHPHAHFVCRGCGRMDCVAPVELPRASIASAKVGKGYRVEFAEITLHGLCPRCRA